MIELTNAHIAALLAIRGGCSCHIRPPCFACTEPPTLAELEELGIDATQRRPAPQLPAEVWNTTPVNADRAMSAVRTMCGGAA